MKSIAALSLSVAVAMGAISAKVSAALSYTPGNVVVVQVNDGAATINSNATKVFLNEYNPASPLSASVSQVAMPTAQSGANFPFTVSGSSTSEGFLKVSTDGNYLTMAGYGVIPGTATPQSSTPTAAARVIARIDMSQNVDTSTALGDAYNGSNIRSAISTDGNNFWTGGNAGSGLGASAAVRYETPLGTTTSTQMNSTTTNIRVVNIFNGQLYASSSSGTQLGVATVGSGLPTTSGQTLTELPGMPTTGVHSNYDFWFMDPNTLYVADDGAVAAGGGIQKWTQSGGTWSQQYILLNNGATTTAVRGLTGEVVGGQAVLFATTVAGSANNLITLTDTGAGATATVLETAPANEVFRGVALIPAVPEPGTCTLLLIASGLALSRRRRSV